MKYQWRERCENDDWMDCDKDWFDYCNQSPEHETRIKQESKISVEAQEALNEMNLNQTYYITKNFKGVMGELVDAGYVERTKNSLGEMLGYRRIKAV